jgi:gluconate 2-dehydrogenase gamma chain
MRRRDLLASSAVIALIGCAAQTPESGLQFFTPEEAARVTAIANRLIPADELGPGAGEVGAARFIDRALAGAYGTSRDLYMRPPFLPGVPSQGAQSPLTPAVRYRVGLAALDAHCRAAFAGRGFVDLSGQEQDRVLADLEQGRIAITGGGRAFFDLVLRDTVAGFFADPQYGGNQGMAGWRLIGFPGARYDYRDVVARHGEPYHLPPVALA